MRHIGCVGALAMVVVLAGCTTERRASPAQTSAEPTAPKPGAEQALRPVAAPDLGRLDGSVRIQMREAYASLQSKARSPETPAPELSAAYGDMGKLFYAAGDYDAAESCLLNAQTLAPAEIRWPYYLGQLFRAKGDPTRSAASFERVLQLRPDHTAALFWLGDAYLTLGRPDAAEPPLQKALALEPNMTSTLVGLGRAALARRDYSRAVERLERALALDRRATAIQYPLAMAYRGLGDSARAEAHMRQRGNVEPHMRDPLMDDISGLLHSAMAFEISGRQALVANNFQAAADDFRKGIVLASDNATLQAELRHKLGTALFLMGDARGGIEQFEKALQRTPEFAPARYSLGVLLISAGQYRRAVEHLSAAVKAEPDYIEGHLRLGDALMAYGRPEESLLHYERVLKIDARVAEGVFGRAMALARLGRFAEARDRLAEGMAGHPGQPAFAYALVRLLAAAPDAGVRDGRRAMDLMRPWLDRDPPGADRDETMAMALAEVGQYDAAAAWQRAALKGAESAQGPDLVKRLAANLALYERHMPCRTPWSAYPLSSEANRPDVPSR